MASIHNFFQLTPKEILDRIVSILDSRDSLLRLSSTCHHLRRVLAPKLFSQVTVQFSAAGLDRLARLSKSDHRQHVETLCYNVVEIIDPVIQSREAFEHSIYPPSAYVSDQADDVWSISKVDLRYEQIWTALKERCKEQQRVLDHSRDMSVLAAALSSLTNLRVFTLRFTPLIDTLSPAFESLIDRITKPVDFSTKRHLIAASQAFHLSQTHERSGRALEIRGDWGSSLWSGWDCHSLLYDTFSSSHELSFASNQVALECICELLLPVLTCLRLTSVRLRLREFFEFVQSRAPRLSTLYLDDVVLSLDEPADTYSFAPHNMPSARLLEAIERIGRCKRLEKVTVTGFPRHQIKDRSCFEDLFCGRLDSSHITRLLIESLTPDDGDEG